jgi:hypothetical protein
MGPTSRCLLFYGATRESGGFLPASRKLQKGDVSGERCSLSAFAERGRNAALLAPYLQHHSGVVVVPETVAMSEPHGVPLLFPLFVGFGLIDEYGQSLVDSDRVESGS